MGVVKEIKYKLDINSLERIYSVTQLAVNDIARIRIHTALPLVFDAYAQNLTTGSLIFISPDTNDTVGAGMITIIK